VVVPVCNVKRFSFDEAIPVAGLLAVFAVTAGNYQPGSLPSAAEILVLGRRRIGKNSGDAGC